LIVTPPCKVFANGPRGPLVEPCCHQGRGETPLGVSTERGGRVPFPHSLQLAARARRGDFRSVVSCLEKPRLLQSPLRALGAQQWGEGRVLALARGAGDV